MSDSSTSDDGIQNVSFKYLRKAQPTVNQSSNINNTNRHKKYLYDSSS